jgi:hypothetical protein
MSTIMDELETLQGKRAPQHAPGPAGPELGEPADAASSWEQLVGHLRSRQRLLAGLVVGLVLLVVALLTLPLTGRARGGRMRASSDAPDRAAAPATHDAVVASGQPGGAARAESAVAAVDAPTADETTEPTIMLSLLAPYSAPTFGPVETSTAADGASADEAVSTENPEEPEAPPADTEPAEPKMALSLLMPYTAPTFGPLDPSGQGTLIAGLAPDALASAPPVRTITKAEDEANKAAIRALKVHAVLSDEHGIGLYTSEGHLHEGSSFRGMEVKTITSRYVVFEYGPKRYKWLLPQ